MKLRNKKTGEIRDIEIVKKEGNLRSGIDGRPLNNEYYDSLAELNEEWEDYEEPKEYWSIDQFGEPINVSGLNALQLEKLRRIGNLFRTKEETKKAVEKLKAFTRLKDNGFRFNGYNACSVDYDIDEQYRKYISQDLDLLFGGEE